MVYVQVFQRRKLRSIYTNVKNIYPRGFFFPAKRKKLQYNYSCFAINVTISADPNFITKLVLYEKF